MTIDDLENRFGLSFPLPHRRDMEDPTSPMHSAVDFLVPGGPGLLDFEKTNEFLRNESWQGWTEQFVAFASNGCGDYFAYDLRSSPYRVLYVDPHESLKETLEKNSEDSMIFDHYSAWRDYKYRQYLDDRGDLDLE